MSLSSGQHRPGQFFTLSYTAGSIGGCHPDHRGSLPTTSRLAGLSRPKDTAVLLRKHTMLSPTGADRGVWLGSVNTNTNNHSAETARLLHKMSTAT